MEEKSLLGQAENGATPAAIRRQFDRRRHDDDRDRRPPGIAGVDVTAGRPDPVDQVIGPLPGPRPRRHFPRPLPAALTATKLPHAAGRGHPPRHAPRPPEHLPHTPVPLPPRYHPPPHL